MTPSEKALQDAILRLLSEWTEPPTPAPTKHVFATDTPPSIRS